MVIARKNSSLLLVTSLEMRRAKTSFVIIILSSTLLGVMMWETWGPMSSHQKHAPGSSKRERTIAEFGPDTESF